MNNPSESLLAFTSERKRIRERSSPTEKWKPTPTGMMRESMRKSGVICSHNRTPYMNWTDADFAYDAHNNQGKMEEIIALLVGALENVEESLRLEHGNFVYDANYKVVNDALTRAAKLTKVEETE